MMNLTDRIENDFTYHAPKDTEEVQRYQDIRAYAKSFAHIINVAVPDGREKSTSLTKLDEVVFWANAGIARNNNE